jgi:hypothetical protein
LIRAAGPSLTDRDPAGSWRVRIRRIAVDFHPPPRTEIHGRRRSTSAYEFDAEERAALDA